jgi:hypothetical protein
MKKVYDQGKNAAYGVLGLSNSLHFPHFLALQSRDKMLPILQVLLKEME